ncbi:GFA family protein [Planktotalea lamellibrachiae]|nr:GFA family protein [Aliiroseovarius lamellibrachiae]
MTNPTDMTGHISGHCLCGQVSFAFQGRPFLQVMCHCDSCRRASGGAIVGFLGLKDTQWRWTGEAPASYESSPGVRRHFCMICGSAMGFQGDHYPGQFFAHAAALSDPSLFAPTAHVHHDEILSWATPRDDLPRHLTTDELL